MTAVKLDNAERCQLGYKTNNITVRSLIERFSVQLFKMVKN